jgi:hypothetical protein
MALWLFRRNCFRCQHWDINWPKVDNGYVEGRCREPKDERDQHLKRGGDSCGRWKPKEQP